MEHVRLPLCGVYFLHDTVMSQPVIKSSRRCMELVEEAKTFHLLQDRRPDLYGPRTRLRKSSSYVEVIVCVGGEDDKVVLRSVEYFNPQTLHWLTLACVPFAISKHGLVVSGNMMYIVGGELPDGTTCKSVWKYDPCFDVWLELESLAEPRAELGLALVDGYLYAIGGWSGDDRLKTVECFDIRNNKWRYASSLDTPVTSPAVVAYEGLLYVIGGAVSEEFDDCNTDAMLCYQATSDQWSRLEPMTSARSGAVACVINGIIYVIGGLNGVGGEFLATVECYNISSKCWSLCAPMTHKRYRPGIAVIDGKIYIFGGEEGYDIYHDSIECYEPVYDQWSVISEMPTGRSWLSCGTLQLQRSMQPMSGGGNSHGNPAALNQHGGIIQPTGGRILPGRAGVGAGLLMGGSE